jgi:hypothetical protein
VKPQCASTSPNLADYLHHRKGKKGLQTEYACNPGQMPHFQINVQCHTTPQSSGDLNPETMLTTENTYFVCIASHYEGKRTYKLNNMAVEKDSSRLLS